MKGLKSDGKSAYLITDFSDRRYFSKVDISEGILVISKEKYYFSDARYFSALKEKLESSEIEAKLYTDIKSLLEFLKSKNISTVFIDYNKTTVKEYKEYKSLGLKIKDVKDRINKLRSVKKREEISCIKKACKITEKAYYYAISKVRKEMTEKELKEILVKKMISLGAEGESFFSIVAFSKNSAVPHHQTGDTRLEENSVILIDTGCKVNGYCSDFTRTCFFGTPDKEFLTAYEQVLRANLTAEEKISVGYSGVQADSIARDYFKSNNTDKYFTHSLGHGIGLDIHEAPYLSKKSKEVLKKGMVFSIEPGLYFENKFGIRIEDTVILKKSGIERFFSDDKSLMIIKTK